MFSIVPLPYRILIGAGILTAAFGLGFHYGAGWNQARADARAVATAAVYEAATKKQIAVNNALSGQLAKAEGTIVIKTVEVIKYVPKVTTGRLCLGSDAVRLLQPGVSARINPAPSKPVAENAAPAASDTDVAYWVADANQSYETCAQRLNTLIDYVNQSLSTTNPKKEMP